MIRFYIAGLGFLLALSACADTGSNIEITHGNTGRHITTFEECAEAGYVVMRTAPAQCRTPDGRVFAEGRGLIGRDEITSRRINSFEDCVAAGNEIRRTLPATCRAPDGRIFTDAPGVPPTGGGLTKKDDKIIELKPLCRSTCGNGTCEEIVCLAEGCPCPETKESCPEDCR